MEKLVVTALEEISAEGPQGCEVSKLWSLLQLHPAVACLQIYVLDEQIKQEIWRGLLQVQSLSFNAGGKQCDPITLSNVDQAQSFGVVIIASQELRDGCLGLYDIRHADTQPSQIQHAILERLATARMKGVTQNELGKEFKVEGNKLFYILRSLESRGLIVRKSTLLRNLGKNGSIVVTNLVHLTRYATHLTLNSHQRLEISNSEEDPVEGGEKQLMINDDVPAMKSICDRLQQADGKILVISDLKLSLGYRMAAGHRAWRRLIKRLEEGGYVTTVKAKVGRKEKPCLQLLKPFNENEQSSGQNDADIELKGPKRGQVTEQLQDLSVDQQIYNMIDVEGADGLTMMEVWKRIGLNNKRNYYRIQNMTVKHGLLFEAENHKRSTVYRLKTSGSKHEADAANGDPGGDKGKEIVLPGGGGGGGGGDALFKVELEEDGNAVVTSLQLSEPGTSAGGNAVDFASPAAAFPPPSLFRKGQAYPCLSVTTTSLHREKNVLTRLQEEKFLVRAELHRWLESVSSQKTTMDRKTLIRTLEKLQGEGKCKCITLEIPGATNCGRKRKADVVLLPSLELDFDLLNSIHERIRKFEVDTRVQGREKAAGSSPVVATAVKRLRVEDRKQLLLPAPEMSSGKSVTLQENGFIPSKMVRVRMLHCFLWSYTAASNMVVMCGGGDGGYRVFGLMDALLTMPLELFLQVIGSKSVISSLAERCKQGTRLCDLSHAEQAALLDIPAGGRLAWLVDILRRLKLIRYAIDYGHLPVGSQASSGQLGAITLTEASLSYALEENIYIEEPPSPSPVLQSLVPRATQEIQPAFTRYDFNISHREGLDNYWQYLEYFYSGAERSIARRAFPGSTAPEIFGLRPWTLFRLMTMEQRNELHKQINFSHRLSVQECAKVAKNLNLTLEQVLRYSYEKNRRVRLQSLKESQEPEGFMQTFTNTSLPAVVAPETSPENNNTSATPEQPEEEEELPDEPASINELNKPARARKYPWTDKLDRDLLFVYARQRALVGVRLNRVHWSLLNDLPAPPDACRRRMFVFKSQSVRKSLLNLVSLLSARYSRYCSEDDQENPRFDPSSCDMTGFKTAEYHWDNPRDPDVVSAIDEVLRCKSLLRSGARKQPNSNRCRAGASFSRGEVEPGDDPLEPSQLAEHLQKPVQVVKLKGKAQKRRVRKKVLKKPSSLQMPLSHEVVRSSLGAATAVEFIKLVFLNSSVDDESVQLPKSFMDGLHQFKESDVFAAFNYLRERNLVASGEGAQSFVLSDEFHERITNSRFTSTHSEEFRSCWRWLQENGELLNKGWVSYTGIDENYGQLLHLFARVVSGELMLEPKLPFEGIGESDEPRIIGCITKRKLDAIDEQEERAVKARTEGSEAVFQAARRERGFPGIETLVKRQVFSVGEMILEHIDDDLQVEESSTGISARFPEPECPAIPEDSPIVSPELLEKALGLIEDAGDEGLSMKQLATNMGLSENPWDLMQTERYCDALEVQSRVKKVNAFDHFRAIAQSLCGHYFLKFSEQAAQMEIDGVEIEELGEMSSPIVPWLTHTGEINLKFLNNLHRRVLSIVALSPGIPEDKLVQQMDMLNPQTALQLIKMLLLEGKLVMRTVTIAPVASPSFLTGLIGVTGERFYTMQNYYYPNAVDLLVM